jgi:L-ascorbate oxidase
MTRLYWAAIIIFTFASAAWADASPVANELADPPVFASKNHLLNLLIVVKAQPITLGDLHPLAYVYQVCQRDLAIQDRCPANAAQTYSPYGGIRLALQPGDHLKFRLVNQLPPADPQADRVIQDPAMFEVNPTNIHTHGLIVEPRQAGHGDPTYGDYVFVLAYPSGHLPRDRHPGLDYTDKPIDYDIYIPPNHPSGLFWFHPHVHGIGLNQVSQGLAGSITMGNLSDYVLTTGKPTVRYMILKDIQVERDDRVKSQEDPDFCAPEPVPGEPERFGFCSGQSEMGETDYDGGKWFFTLNGQVFPSIHLKQDQGEVWRILTAAGSRSWDLSLKDDATGKPLTFQVLSLDGVAFDGSKTRNMHALEHEVGGKFVPFPCAEGRHAICTTRVRMMPSSRVELYLPPSSTARATSATFETAVFPTGPAGDSWPSAKLAKVYFPSRTPKLTPESRSVEVAGQAAALTQPDGILGNPVTISVPGITKAIPIEAAKKLSTSNRAVPMLDANTSNEIKSLNARQLKNVASKLESLSSPNCQALAKGHVRRIFFGVPANDSEAFGLGYEETDEHGQPVPGSFQDIHEFNHTEVNVCLPLAEENRPVTEQWELVNVSGEDHNFHMHQTKFKVIAAADPSSGDTGVMMDNVPVPHGSDECDGSVSSWRSGVCKVQPVKVAIPFSEIGDFVYHCHILEHEDGGMMAHIRVVANP